MCMKFFENVQNDIHPKTNLWHIINCVKNLTSELGVNKVLHLDHWKTPWIPSEKDRRERKRNYFKPFFGSVIEKTRRAVLARYVKGRLSAGRIARISLLRWFKKTRFFDEIFSCWSSASWHSWRSLVHPPESRVWEIGKSKEDFG